MSAGDGQSPERMLVISYLYDVGSGLGSAGAGHPGPCAEIVENLEGWRGGHAESDFGVGNRPINKGLEFLLKTKSGLNKKSRRQAFLERKRPIPAVPLAGTCGHCRQPYFGSPRSEYCSNVCSRKASKAKDRKTPNYRARRAYSRRLKKIMGRKQGKTCYLLGCTPDQLRAHLESLWQPGMSWSNYGGTGYGEGFWQIDHIRPCASFDLTDPEQQKQCFHYTNLQPLWALDNHAKSCLIAS